MGSYAFNEKFHQIGCAYNKLMTEIMSNAAVLPQGQVMFTALPYTQSLKPYVCSVSTIKSATLASVILAFFVYQA